MKTVAQHMAELKDEDWRLGCEASILALAEELHGVHTGASDAHLSMGQDWHPRLLAIIKKRLENWTPSKYDFDACVKALLEAVVREAEEGCGTWLYC